uniref:Uncharacterized protein n=1 Tax=Avena sativa TaxID=4498 RepID=A0ACD5WPK0_AVESA
MGVEVKAAEPCIVKPSEETPRHGLWLSSLDLMLAKSGHVPLVYFYRSCPGTDGDVARLKVALARALVSFYPLAGRVGVDGDGRMQVDCAEQGVPFLVAHSDHTVDEFSSFKPSPELRRLFVPCVDDSPSVVCAIQVTFLGCGGVALGAALHHAVADGASTFHFFRTWSAFSSGDGAAAAALELPCHDRTLLRARSPPVVHPDALSVFCPKLSPSELSGAVANETFDISKEQLDALKRACGRDVSTFCALGAHVWRCVVAARRLPPDATTRLVFPANVRGRLRPPIPDSYFGNGIIMLGATGKAREVASEEHLASVAGRIRGAISRMDDELVHSAIDYLELDLGGSSLPTKNELRVVKWLDMTAYGADFGWGKPLVMHLAVQQRAGFVYLMDGVGGSVRILVSLEHAILNDFQRLLHANAAKL